MQEDAPDEEVAVAVAAAKEETMNKVLMQAFTLTFLAEMIVKLVGLTFRGYISDRSDLTRLQSDF